MSKIVCICLSATIQKTIQFKTLNLENVNRSENYIKDASGKAVNSARVLNQLEPQTSSVVCPLGIKNANEFLELAEKDSINITAVKIPGFTRECWTLIDRSRHTTTELVVSEPKFNEDYSAAEEELLFEARKEIEKSEAVRNSGRKKSAPLSQKSQKAPEKYY